MPAKNFVDKLISHFTKFDENFENAISADERSIFLKKELAYLMTILQFSWKYRNAVRMIAEILKLDEVFDEDFISVFLKYSNLYQEDDQQQFRFTSSYVIGILYEIRDNVNETISQIDVKKYVDSVSGSKDFFIELSTRYKTISDLSGIDRAIFDYLLKNFRVTSISVVKESYEGGDFPFPTGLYHPPTLEEAPFAMYTSILDSNSSFLVVQLYESDEESDEDESDEDEENDDESDE